MSWRFIISILAITVSYLIYGEWLSRRTIPNVPWVGKQKTWFFPKTRAYWRGLIQTKELILEGYYKVGSVVLPLLKGCDNFSTCCQYSKNGQFFILPSIVWDAAVIVPKSVIPALLALPEDQISTEDHQNDLIQSDYTLPNRWITRYRIHNEIMKKKLPRFYPAWIPAIIEEIEAGYEEFWGLDTDGWSEVDLHDTTLKIITRMSSRLLVGPDICTFDFKKKERRSI